LPGATAQVGRADAIPQQRSDRATQFGSRSDFHQRARRPERIGDFAEVFHMPAHHNGLAEHGWLEDVVSSARNDGAAHEYHVGPGEQPAQLAHGIEQQDAGQSE
jgi:hypothetical protein